MSTKRQRISSTLTYINTVLPGLVPNVEWQRTGKACAILSIRNCLLGPRWTFLLHEFVDKLLYSLVQFCDSSLTKGILSARHKLAIVFLLLNNLWLDPNNISNYWPIRILTLFSKIIKRAYSAYCALPTSKWPYAETTGFRKGHSTPTVDGYAACYPRCKCIHLLIQWELKPFPMRTTISIWGAEMFFQYIVINHSTISNDDDDHGLGLYGLKP